MNLENDDDPFQKMLKKEEEEKKKNTFIAPNMSILPNPEDEVEWASLSERYHELSGNQPDSLFTLDQLKNAVKNEEMKQQEIYKKITGVNYDKDEPISNKSIEDAIQNRNHIRSQFRDITDRTPSDNMTTAQLLDETKQTQIPESVKKEWNI